MMSPPLFALLVAVLFITNNAALAFQSLTPSNFGTKHSSAISKPPAFVPHSYQSNTATLPPKSSSALAAFFGSPGDDDLIVGFGTIAAACSPYTLSLLLPDFFNTNFFLPIYKNETEAQALAAREAEIGWKVRYTTLALALTTLMFTEVTWIHDEDPAAMLRDSYYIWAIFYADAALKILREYQKDMLTDNRSFIQLWHILVAAILVLDVSTGPRANALMDFIKVIFTLDEISTLSSTQMNGILAAVALGALYFFENKATEKDVKLEKA